MKLTDEERGIVAGVIEYAGPDMDPGDQAFYLRCWVPYDDSQVRQDANLAKLIDAGVLEIHPDTAGPVLTAAALAAVGVPAP